MGFTQAEILENSGTKWVSLLDINFFTSINIYKNLFIKLQKIHFLASPFVGITLDIRTALDERK